MRILFRGKSILMHDDKLNRDLEITKFVKYLAQWGILSNRQVPDKYYQAWKILVLGCNEYDDNAFHIITTAQEAWLKGGE